MSDEIRNVTVEQLGKAARAAAKHSGTAIHAPIIGTDNYWYLWNTETGEYAKTDVLAIGQKGDTGPQGNKGADGANGYTPVKGTDYWTETDKAEIESELKTWAGQQGYITVVDSALSETSKNPVQNKVIYAQLGDISSALDSILNGTA